MKITWTEPANNDVQEIFDFIALDSQSHARSITASIVNAVQSLFQFPLLGRKVPEFGSNKIREIMSGNYRIIYFVEEQKITILRVIHGRRDVQRITLN